MPANVTEGRQNVELVFMTLTALASCVSYRHMVEGGVWGGLGKGEARKPRNKQGIS